MAENAYYINTYIIYTVIVLLLLIFVDYMRWFINQYNKDIEKQKRRRLKRIIATEYDRNCIL
jgi:hypothetical protein